LSFDDPAIDSIAAEDLAGEYRAVPRRTWLQWTSVRILMPSATGFCESGRLLAELAGREGWAARHAAPSLANDALQAVLSRTWRHADRDRRRFRSISAVFRPLASVPPSPFRRGRFLVLRLRERNQQLVCRKAEQGDVEMPAPHERVPRCQGHEHSRREEPGRQRAAPGIWRQDAAEAEEVAARKARIQLSAVPASGSIALVSIHAVLLSKPGSTLAARKCQFGRGVATIRGEMCGPG
jgi:hypothetical protein